MAIANKQRSSTVKVGVLTLVSLGLLIFALIWLRGKGLATTEPIEVLFKDVDGMREGASVQMMGIRIGFVNSVEPVQVNGKYYVRVTFNLNRDIGVAVPSGSRIAIEQSGIIGEKFLEITPPQLREVVLTTFKEPAQAIRKGIPVKMLFESGYLVVGEVENVERYTDNNLVRHRLYYRITKPGAEMPKDPLLELTMDENQQYYLRILSKEPVLAQAPDPNLRYTIENPLRIKRFLEIQMESAEALKTTNEKINELLNDETIETLHSTVKNTEVLTARANEVLDSANQLFLTTRTDLTRLVAVSEELAGNVSSVSKNINDVIGDPVMKRDLVATVSSLNESSRALRDVLNDPALRETITLSRDASRNASELMAYLRNTSQDPELQRRLNTSLTLLNESLAKLSNVLDNVDELTDDKDETLKNTLKDTREAAENLKRLTGKFNGHFTLFKLLF